MKGQIETDTEKNMPLMNERKNLGRKKMKGKIERNKKNHWLDEGTNRMA